MYIQITDKCNMTCQHCCFSCGPKSGLHMSEKTFFQAVSLCEERGSYITIGGGEPTLHPKFWNFIGYLMSRAHRLNDEITISLVTNGKRTEDALALAALAKKGILDVELSVDQYHQQVDERVVKAFTRKQRPYGYDSTIPQGDYPDLRNIRTVTGIISQGRGKDISGAKPGCSCPEELVDTSGNIWGCGCKDFPLGTVFDPNFPEGFEAQGECMSRALEGVGA